MSHLKKIHTVRVFVDEENRFGSPLGIVEDEKNKIDKTRRQEIAHDLNYSETVFIDNPKTGAINVFSPIRECPFSMYAALGAAWFIGNELKCKVGQLISKNQEIKIFSKQNRVWVRSKTSILPSWNFVECKTAVEIESFAISDFAEAKHVMIWAWIDKTAGIVRARTFAADWGIPEDEANGSGTMRLASTLQRDIIVHHGKGSVLSASPSGTDYVDVGGRCILQA